MDSIISAKGLLISAVSMVAFIHVNPMTLAQDEKQSPRFKIDARTPLSELLPAWQSAAKSPLLVKEDLENVPEVMLSEPLSGKQKKEEALEKIAHLMAKINHLNTKDPDGFMVALLTRRRDLKGLPLRMGKDCRTSPEQAILNNAPVRLIHAYAAEARTKRDDEKGAIMEKAWTWMRTIKGSRRGVQEDETVTQDDSDGVVAAAAMQILASESASVRVGLAKFLAELRHDNATHALVKLALFSQEEDVRSAAIAGLKRKRAKDYTDLLMQGFEYPLPAVARRAAQALVELDCKELVPNLIKVLEQPDPRIATKKGVNGKNVYVVREVVKINHHRNCMLCHSPGNTQGVPFGVMLGDVPLPTEPLPPPAQALGYGDAPANPDIAVRIDTTYLRQDFSLMLPVPNAEPWPEQQRFDFLVRARELTTEMAEQWRDEFANRTAGESSPYHRAALGALRALTGRNAGPTPRAWRELLRPTVSQ